MASLQQQVIDLLEADATTAAWAEGGIYDRPLKRAGQGATPNAFNPDGSIRPSLVVTDDGDTEHPGRDDALLGYLAVWFYGPDTAEIREEIRAQIGPHVRIVAASGAYATEAGRSIDLHPADRLGVRPAVEFTTAVVDYQRFVADHLWR